MSVLPVFRVLRHTKSLTRGLGLTTIATLNLSDQTYGWENMHMTKWLTWLWCLLPVALLLCCYALCAGLFYSFGPTDALRWRHERCRFTQRDHSVALQSVCFKCKYFANNNVSVVRFYQLAKHKYYTFEALFRSPMTMPWTCCQMMAGLF